jgi:ATP-dependent DNA ligase
LQRVVSGGICGSGTYQIGRLRRLRIMARRDGRGVHLFSRNGDNFGDRFPPIAGAIEAMSDRSCLIDGEAIVVDSRGVSVFDLLRYQQNDRAAVLCASI